MNSDFRPATPNMPSHPNAVTTLQVSDTLGVGAVVLLFIGLSTYKISSPGLYYDEMLFAPSALPSHHVPHAAYRTWLGIPLMVFSYIGALKAWLYTPIFRAFGVSAVTVRLPVILISGATLCVGYALARRHVPRRWALAFTLACAIQPAFVLKSKVD